MINICSRIQARASDLAYYIEAGSGKQKYYTVYTSTISSVTNSDTK